MSPLAIAVRGLFADANEILSQVGVELSLDSIGFTNHTGWLNFNPRANGWAVPNQISSITNGTGGLVYYFVGDMGPYFGLHNGGDILIKNTATGALSALPENALDIIDGASRNRHSDIFAEGIAAWAKRDGITRDEMSGAFLQVADRLKEASKMERRGIILSWLDVFGGTNALPALQRIALDTEDPNGWNAIGAYYAIAGFTPDSLAWAESFLREVKPERAARRKDFFNVFRHALNGDDTPPPERAALGRVLFRATEAEDDSPAWTDEVLRRRFPDYASSAERRARLEAALARVPAAPAKRTDSAPDWTNLLRTSLSNALATATATNAAPFEIPALRAAPRVLPDEFVLPEIPQEWRQ